MDLSFACCTELISVTSTVLEDAREGDVKAIASLINRSLQKKGISASVRLEHGDLEIMLDGRQIPPESVANFLLQGLKKIDVEAAYDVYIYGRKVGEPFATWCRDYELKPRPFGLVFDSDRDQVSATRQPSGGINIQLSGPNSQAFNIDAVYAVGFVGIFITILGVFSPVMTAPIVGSLSYLRNGAEEAVLLLILTALSVLFLVKKRYSWLYGSSVWALLLVGSTCLYYQSVISDAKSSLDRDLAGNPFRGLAEAAMAGTGLSWGWFLLFLGTGLVVVTAYLKQRKLDRQALVAMVVTPLVPIAILMTVFFATMPYHAITSQGQANRARESEASNYVGAINRGQQAFHLEELKFAENLDRLDVAVPNETDNYEYEITSTDNDMTAATATAKRRGLKSITGAVFVGEDAAGDFISDIILCKSDKPAKKAPGIPTLSQNGEFQCASGSSEL